MLDAEHRQLRSKLAWRCRRGTKELDSLLSKFFARYYDNLNAKQQAAFALLLEQQDPLIMDWLWGRCSVPQDKDLAEVVSMIRRDAGT